MILYRLYHKVRLLPHRVKIGFLTAAVFMAAVILQACGVQVGVNDDYISERNVPDRSVAQAYVRPDENPGVVAGSQGWGSGYAVVSTARSQTGVPYRNGGVSPQSGFDCSGLLIWVYRQHGISVPRLARAQASFGQFVSFAALQPGDIVAFRINGAYHTGIYSGNGNFIHSPSSGSRVREESLNVAYWRNRFVGGRRVL